MLQGPELRGQEGNGVATDSCPSAGLRQRKSQAEEMGCYGNQRTQAKVREFCSVSEWGARPGDTLRGHWGCSEWGGDSKCSECYAENWIASLSVSWWIGLKFRQVCKGLPCDLVLPSHSGSGLRHVGCCQWGIGKQDMAEARKALAQFGLVAFPLCQHTQNMSGLTCQMGRHTGPRCTSPQLRASWCQLCE